MAENFPNYDASGLPVEPNPADDGAATLEVTINELMYQLDKDKIPDNPAAPPTPPKS